MHPVTGPGKAMSLLWRVFLLNALVLVAATAVLAFSPATVSKPLVLEEGLVLVAGLSAMLIVNLVLIRFTFVPLERLRHAMRDVDLVRPGERLTALGPGEVSELVTVFNQMLDRLERERRESGRRALTAQEAERARVAKELHDEVGQALTALMLQINRLVKRAPEDLRQELLEARETARSNLDDVRQIAKRLRPEVLDDLGLVSALIALTTTFSEQTGIRVERHVAGDLLALDSEVELVVYRVAQESLTNVARHANTSRAKLHLERSHNGVRLRVIDEGRGLGGAAPGRGILGMQERALLVGGDIVVESRREGGVQVRLEIPVRADTV